MTAVGIALLPLALLVYVQADRVQTEARARAEAAIFGETLLAAQPQLEAITEARGQAAALAVAVRRVTEDRAVCIDLMRRMVADTPMLSFAGFLRPDAVVDCGSNAALLNLDGDPWVSAFVADLVANPREVMAVNPRGPVSGESVLVFAHPVLDDAGALMGFVTLSLPHRALAPRGEGAAAGATAIPRPLALVTFDADGTVLTAQHGMDTVVDRLPAVRPLAEFVGRGATTFAARNTLGEARTFAVVPIVEGALYVLSSWPAAVTSNGVTGEMPLWLLPAAMWLASLLVAWMVAEHQVLRHIRGLRQSIIAFAGGSRAVEPPALGRAPQELRDVGDAYERMMDSVLHDEAALEDMVHQKEVLLREVHHRVKNNLQLIASIMNMQMRKAVSPEAKALIKGLRDRVMSLATVHRELYQTSGLTDVRADELLASIVGQVVKMGSTPEREIDVTTDFDALRLTPDQSVPLSLALTETLTNALKHSGRGQDGRVHLSVDLKRSDDGRAVLRVANSTPLGERTVPPGADSTGLGGQLLSAFALQLGGQIASTEAGDQYMVSIDFPLRALAEAEERFEETEPA